MKLTLLFAVWWAGAGCATALAAGSPKIQFDQTLFDFGKTSLVASVSGTFKIKNVGDALLKLQPPQPSCGCTIAGLKPDTLQPGETGELTFSLNLGNSRASLEKHISVLSNDPLAPVVSLAIRVDYTPLYDINPMTLATELAFGVDEVEQFASLTRTDGKPLRILRLEASQPWITAKAEPKARPDGSTARIRMAVKRDGTPRRFNEYVRVYSDDKTNEPVSTIYLYGQMLGEVSVSPDSLYWSVASIAQLSAKRPEALATRLVTIRSATGKAFELKNPQSSIAGIHVELVPKESGKVYELVAKLDQTPGQTVSGSVSFETSVAKQPKIEVPVIVNVFTPSSP